jgi:hypothetical protein
MAAGETAASFQAPTGVKVSPAFSETRFMIDQVIEEFRRKRLTQLLRDIDAIEASYYRERFGVTQFQRIDPAEPYQRFKGVTIDGITLLWDPKPSSGLAYRWEVGIPAIRDLHPFLDVVRRDEEDRDEYSKYRIVQGIPADIVEHYHWHLTARDVTRLLAIADDLPREKYFPKESRLWRWMFPKTGTGSVRLCWELDHWEHRDEFLELLDIQDNLKEKDDEDQARNQPEPAPRLRGLPGPRQADAAAPDPTDPAAASRGEDGQGTTLLGVPIETPTPAAGNGTLVRLTH